jgi:hypothetical protein
MPRNWIRSNGDTSPARSSVPNTPVTGSGAAVTTARNGAGRSVSMSPRAWSARNASRTVVRLTPYCSASSRSAGSSSPVAKWPAWIALRR